MKRRLLNLYRWRVPKWMDRLVPKAVLATGAGLANRFWPHPDFVFYHARHLIRQGRGAEAERLYTRGEPLVDPVFACHLEEGEPPNGPLLPLELGQFHVEFSYMGLKIATLVKTPARAVEILIEGQCVRREMLTYWQQRAECHFTVKWAALALCKPVAKLSVRLESGQCIQSRSFGGTAELHIPHGQGGLNGYINRYGRLGKKGSLPPTTKTLAKRQAAYLELYDTLRPIFQKVTGKPLILVCGTLLGQHRGDGDGFIPGDDDFDVGYVSHATTGAGVKREAIAYMEALAEAGVLIMFNRHGKPMRLGMPGTGPLLHLDVTPIFRDASGHVLLHKLSCLLIDFSAVEETVLGEMQGVEVEKPRDSDAFLSAYYGVDWRIPNPEFSYANRRLPPYALKALNATCLTLAEQRALVARVEAKGGAGRVIAPALLSPYPLGAERRTGQ